MPPKVKVEADKTFSEDTVALILAVSGASLGMKEYEMMAKLGGGRTAGGYQHHFRSVKARARELAEQIKKNGDVVSTGPTKTPDARTPKKGGKYIFGILERTMTDLNQVPSARTSQTMTMTSRRLRRRR